MTTTAILDNERKRDLESRRLFAPGGQFREGSIRIETPEPTGQQIVTLLGRLTEWLDREFDLFIADHILAAVAASQNPWTDLENLLERAGSGAAFDQVKETVTELHDDKFRISMALDLDRVDQTLPATTRKALGAPLDRGEPSLSDEEREALAFSGVLDEPAAASAPEPGEIDDAGMYLAELERLTTKEGLSEQQAHALLAEWGWQNPVIRFDNEVLETMAEGLAVMKATGEYSGPVAPADLLTVNSLESAFQLLEEEWQGTLTVTDGVAVLQTLPGIGENLEEARQNAAEAFAGRPPLPDVVSPDSRAFLGVHPDFVVNVPPRAPHAQRRARKLEAGDDLGAFPTGRAGFTQEPEYREDDQFNMFAGLGFEQTMLYQTMLVDAGWLSPEDFAIEQGQPSGGFATWDAMETAMVASNRTEAESWIEAAQISAATRERNDAAAAGLDREPVPVWTPATYLSPDPDRLTQIVKSAFRSQLGREPTAQEISGLIGSLSGEFRGEFEAQEAIDKAAFVQGIAAQEAAFGPIDPQTGERTVVPLAEGETFRTVDNPLEQVVGVDPISSFQEDFEARFAEEMARGAQRVTQRDARRDIMGSIFAIDAAVGGGR